MKIFIIYYCKKTKLYYMYTHTQIYKWHIFYLFCRIAFCYQHFNITSIILICLVCLQDVTVSFVSTYISWKQNCNIVVYVCGGGHAHMAQWVKRESLSLCHCTVTFISICIMFCLLYCILLCLST